MHAPIQATMQGLTPLLTTKALSQYVLTALAKLACILYTLVCSITAITASSIGYTQCSYPSTFCKHHALTISSVQTACVSLAGVCADCMPVCPCMHGWCLRVGQEGHNEMYQRYCVPATVMQTCHRLLLSCVHPDHDTSSLNLPAFSDRQTQLSRHLYDAIGSNILGLDAQ